MKRATLAVLIALSVVHAPAAAGPQEPGDLVSKDLVERLLAGHGGFGGATIVEGLPPDFPPGLLPDGAVARIAMASRSSTTVLAEVPDFSQAGRPRYERKLAAAGWARRAAQGRAQRGFTMSGSVPMDMFCRDGKFANYAVSPKRDGGWWIHVSLLNFGGRSSCDEPSPGAGPMPSIFDSERMPALTPPAGSHVGSMSGGAGDNHEEQQLSLDTRLTHAEVADHYLALLTAHGWKIEARASVEGLAVIRLSAALGETERSTPAVLTTMAIPEEGVTVSLRIFRSPPWRR